MNEAGDIVGLSIPFVTGLAAAAFLPGWGDLYLKAGCGMAASAILFAVYCGKGDRRVIGVFLFAALGWFCWQNSELCALTSDPGPHGFITDHAGAALGKLTMVIESCGFSPRTEALLEALLTGRKGALDPETVQAFRRSGASHILALSGLHLGIIYGILRKALSPLGNGRAASDVRSALIVAICTFYCLMTGCGPSIVRALIFITVNEISEHYICRRKSSAAVLCTALTAQLAANPAVIKSLGFQLSYLAMAGIVMLFPKMNSWYPSEGGKMDFMRKIWTSMALTVSCQVFTAPLVWHCFHTFPKYFLLTNIIALPLTEGLISIAVVCLLLKAAGITPDPVHDAVEWLADSLMFHLEIISSI